MFKAEQRKKRLVIRRKANFYFTKGLEYYEEGKLLPAIELWQEALKLDPHNKEVKKYLKKAKKRIKKEERKK